MSIYHGGFQILVTQQGLNSANVRSSLQQMRSKTMPESVCTHFFGDVCLDGQPF